MRPLEHFTPTVEEETMKTVADVKKWLSGHDGEAGDDIDDDDVEQAFLILYGRVPDEEDRAVGLFSHVCAYFQ